MRRARFIFILVLGICGVSFLLGCGGSNKTPPNTITTSGSNVVPIAVNSGPGASSGFPYANGAFATVKVCIPGSSTCQSIDGVLVDTGSFGLRILSSLVTISLPQEQASDGNSMVECLNFLASYTWGPVQMADVEIGGEKASSVPVQILSDTDFEAPASCTSVSGGASADTLATLGANGILGVGQLPQDCGINSTCPASANQYYSCPSSTGACTPVAATVAQQVPNPVALFPTDNNGVIIELPAVPGAEATASGSLVFGIGTESNNSLGSATVYPVSLSSAHPLDFSTTFNGNDYDDSFIDSGSNAYFFPDTSIIQCPIDSGAYGFYCPNNTTSLSATNGGNTGSGKVTFSVGNAILLFSNSADAAFGDLGGPANNYFDWGLPFFYGRNVFTSIAGTTAPGGATPYWAY